MFEALKCRLNGHLFVDSRSQPGVQVCVRCRHRQAFEGLRAASPTPATPQDKERLSGRLPGDPAPS